MATTPEIVAQHTAAEVVCGWLAADAYKPTPGGNPGSIGDDRTHALLNVHGWPGIPAALVPYVHQVGPHKFIAAGVLAAYAVGRYELPPVAAYGHE